MKVATYNINGIIRRLPNLLAWLQIAQPDVVALQELKAETATLPQRELRAAGYEAVWRGQRSWNGVAILARGVKPVLTKAGLPGDDEDEYEARDVPQRLPGRSTSPRRRRRRTPRTSPCCATGRQRQSSGLTGNSGGTSPNVTPVDSATAALNLQRLS